MARNWQFLLLAGALFSLAAGWADKIDGEKHGQERSRGRVWDDNRGQYCPGVVCAPAGLTRVWEAISYGRGYPLSESEKEWRKEQKEREKDRREGWKEREKDRREIRQITGTGPPPRTALIGNKTASRRPRE